MFFFVEVFFCGVGLNFLSMMFDIIVGFLLLLLFKWIEFFGLEFRIVECWGCGVVNWDGGVGVDLLLMCCFLERMFFVVIVWDSDRLGVERGELGLLWLLLVLLVGVEEGEEVFFMFWIRVLNLCLIVVFMLNGGEWLGV